MLTLSLGIWLPRKEFEPCWEAAEPNATRNPFAGPGRLAQGSCDVHCRKNISEYESVCVANSGFVCETEYDLGTDGTEVKFTLPTCLPTACRAEIEEGGASRLHHRGRNTSDLLAIQACMQRHTCEGSSELRRLVPECKVTLSCLDEQEIADLTVWLILGFVGALAFTSLALKAGVLSCCWRKQRKRTKEEQEELNFFVGAAHEESPNNLSAPLLNEQSSGGSVQSQASRFVLSEDLARQQNSGRFALGGRGPRAPHSSLSSDAESFEVRLGEETGSANHYSHYMPGTALTYRNLFFRHKGQLILRGVSGILQRGTCVAVIGAPDSGTTTLLRCLAGRQPKGRVEGSILIDGRPPDRKIRRIIAFVPKEDVNISLMTVRKRSSFCAL